MQKSLPFFNWSLKKALDAEPDNFAKARIKIIFTVLLFTLAKILVAGITALAAGQTMQTTRAAITLVVYIGLVKLLLGVPTKMKAVAQVMLLAGLATVWVNIFFFTHAINLINLQFIFMIILSGFYMLGSTWGLIYSVLGVTPVMMVLTLGDRLDIYSANEPQQLASPGFEIVVVLNFITIIVAHYLFFKAFRSSLSEKEELNNQLQRAATEANSLAASRSNFLSTISHELRTPLNAVIGTSELLMDDTPEEHQKENLKVMHSSALDLLSLINNVLDFNKIDSDKLELEQVPVRLDEFVQSVCAALNIRANAKKLKFNLHMDDCVRNLYVVTDPTRLSQILYNLIGNAIKFTEQGSIDVNLSCTTKTDNNIGVLFSVADTGIGIPADKHTAIFDAFTQADSHVTRKYGGTGLGLPIVKQLLTIFNSKIELESSPGRGSRFFFTLDFTTTQAPAAVPLRQSVNLSSLKVLVAEDNEVNRAIIKKQLKTLDVTPVIVENGALAYDAWLSGGFDAVLIDLHMPVADGYETIKRIRAHAESAKANTHAIAFTASVNEKEQILAAGFDDFLYKPANTQHLREKLEEIALQLGKQ